MASEKLKRDYQLAEEQKVRLGTVAEQLLPRVLAVYETSISANFRIKTLKLIDKIVSLMDPTLLKSFLEPSQFANFVIQILRSRHSGSITVALDMSQRVLECSPMTHAVPFVREGVSELIRQLSTVDNFKAFMGISPATSISDKGFDLEIYETKESLHQIRAKNPDDHATRDFFERRLIELVDRQKQSEKPKEGPNAAMKIIDSASKIMQEYFDNSAFIDNLRQFSDQTKIQLGLMDELTRLATKLSEEACVLHLTPSNLNQAR